MIVKTVHRQFGSKARVAHHLLQLLPEGRIWVEVFAGTAAMTIGKSPHPVEHINDLNGSVVNLFSVLRDPAQCERLCELIDLTPWAQAEFHSCINRTADPDPVEWARRFLVASWQAIGGKQAASTGWRLQRDQPWCIGTWSRLPNRLRTTASRLRDVYVHRRHCLDMVAMFADRPDAILFLDPPYPLAQTGTHRQTVYEVDMEDDEHRALAMALLEVDARVLLTMVPGTTYDAILRGWERTEYRVRGLKNSWKTEVLFTNFAPRRDLLHGLLA